MSRTPGPSLPSVSIVIPCYNGARLLESSLRKLLQFLEHHRPTLGDWEVIVVDDGSTDGTAGLVTDHFPEVTLLRHPENQGKGAAVKTGMLAASGIYRFFVDADLPYELDALLQMHRYLDLKEFDICIGSRPRGTHLIRRTLLRRLASYAFTLFVSRIVVTGVRDTQCGFKGFRATVAQYLFGQSRVSNFAFDIEALYLAFKNDLDVKRIPVTLVAEDLSTVSVLRDGPGMLFEILRLPIRYHLRRYQPMAGRPAQPR